MRMINSLTADALDSARFVEAIKEQQEMALKQARQEMADLAQSLQPETRPWGENRAQRRARERMERRAEKRAAKVQP